MLTCVSLCVLLGVPRVIHFHAQSDPAVVAKLKAAMGLALLHTSKYKQAARKFVDVNAELGMSYTDVLAPQVWGGTPFESMTRP
eukprot:359240-Chlamydomonas_euryale.AAC.8